MEETTLNTQYGSIKISQVVKILTAGIGQSALLDSVEQSEFDKTKKMLGRTCSPQNCRSANRKAP